MSIILRINKVTNNARLCLLRTRKYATTPDTKGLVLGAYTENECIELTPAAKKLDDQLAGKLTKNLGLAGQLKDGSSRVFWGLTDDYNAVVVVGMGKKNKGFDELENICSDRECARSSAAVGCQELDRLGVTKICVEDFEYPECAAEGAVLSLFKFQEYRCDPKPEPCVSYFTSRGDAAYEQMWTKGCIKGEAQNLARRLAERPANKLTPTIFANQVNEHLSKKKNMTVEIHDKAWIEAQNMGAFLSVAAGACEEPKFVEITYCNGEAGPPGVLVGKGVTFDSGGISIKPSLHMDLMRGDMAGAACIVAAVGALADLDVQDHLKCLIPMTENMVSGSSTRPGDVVQAMNGKTIAVDNTDAEGRLILADALCYAACFKPKWVIDVATLTGAIGVALGKGAAGVYANNHNFFRSMECAGGRTGDRVWRMPLWKNYTNVMTKHPGYDLSNIGCGRGGSCTAAAFLREFVPADTRWMHLDIAAVAEGGQPQIYLKKHKSGRPTRTLIDFIITQKN